MKYISNYIAVIILSLTTFSCQKDNTIIDDTIKIDPKMFGKIYCDTFPSGVEIYVDSISTGKFTPSIIDSLSEGIQAVKYAKKYFYDYELAVQVRLNTVPAVRCTLKQAINTTLYFPLTVGSSWYYQRSDTGVKKSVDTTSILIANIDSSINIGVGSLWIEKQRLGSTMFVDSLVAKVSNDSVNISMRYTINPALRTFSFPLYVGKKWKVAHNEYTVDTVETVMTKAGIFENCFKVRHQVTIPNTYGFTWYWIHPQNGIIKIYDFDGQQLRFQVWNLMSYNVVK